MVAPQALQLRDKRLQQCRLATGGIYTERQIPCLHPPTGPQAYQRIAEQISTTSAIHYTSDLQAIEFPYTAWRYSCRTYHWSSQSPPDVHARPPDRKIAAINSRLTSWHALTHGLMSSREKVNQGARRQACCCT